MNSQASEFTGALFVQQPIDRSYTELNSAASRVFMNFIYLTTVNREHTTELASLGIYSTLFRRQPVDREHSDRSSNLRNLWSLSLGFNQLTGTYQLNWLTSRIYSGLI